MPKELDYNLDDMGEVISNREVVLRFLDHVGNQERKMGAAALMLAQPSAPFTIGQLTNRINKHQGETQPWPIKWTTTEGYVKTDFLPAKLAVELPEQAPGSRTYNALGEYYELLQATVGFETLWSLDNPDFSVQRTLGTSSSRSIRSPRTRHQLYGLVLADPGQSISKLNERYQELYGTNAEALERQVRDLRKLGILAIEITDRYNPMLEVVSGALVNADDEPRKQLRGLLATFPRGTQISLNDLFSLLRYRYPDSHFPPLRNRVINKLYHNPSRQTYAGLRLVDGATVPEDDVTGVKLSSHVAPALAEFHKHIENIIRGEIDRSYIRGTRQVAEKEAMFAALIAKGKKFSVHPSRSTGETLSSLVVSVMRTDEVCSAHQIHEKLYQKLGRQVSMVHLRRVLSEMALDRFLERDLGSDQKTSFYTLTNVGRALKKPRPTIHRG